MQQAFVVRLGKMEEISQARILLLGLCLAGFNSFRPFRKRERERGRIEANKQVVVIMHYGPTKTWTTCEEQL